MRKFTITVMAALLTMGSGQICAQSTEQGSDEWTEVYTRTYDDKNADNAGGIASTGKHEGTAVAWVDKRGSLKFGTDEFRKATKWKVTMDVASTSTDVKVWLKKNSANLGNGFEGLEFFNWFAPSIAEATLVWHQLILVGDAATGKVTMTITNSKDGAWDNGAQLGNNFQNIDEFGFYGASGLIFFDNVRCYVGTSEAVSSKYVTVADDNFDDNVVPARFRGAWRHHGLMNHGTGKGLYAGDGTNDARYLASAKDVTSDGWRLTADLAFRTKGGGGIYFKEGGTNVITLLPTEANASTLKLSGDKVGIDASITIPGNPDTPADENLTWTTVVLTGSKSKGQITFSAKNSDGKEIVKETVVNSFKNISNIGFFAPRNSFAYLDNVKYELTTDATVPVKVTDAGKATYTSLLPLDFSQVEGLKAYTATSYADAKLTMTKADNAPAMTGLVVMAASGCYNVPVAATTTAPETNLLKGVVEKTTVKATEGDYTNFFLKDTGFAPAVESSDLAAGKAYLQLPTSSKPAASAKIAMVFSDEDETTAITSAKANVKDNDTVYDLQGRIVKDQLLRGIYIRGGKKFIVK